MGITYRLDTALGAIIERWEGVITYDMVCEHWLKMASDDQFLSCDKSIVLAFNGTPDFSTLDLHTAIRKVHRENLTHHGRRIAICVKGQDRERLAKAFALFADKGQIIKMFENQTDATDWLLSKQV
jgi:hypothetical protein